MQISLKTVAASVVLALSAMPALAVESVTTGNSSLFVTVFDPVVGTSVVQDLGINYAEFLEAAVTPDEGFSRSFNIDLSVFGGSVSNLQYSVFAGDSTGNYTTTEVIGTASLTNAPTGINSSVVGMLSQSAGVFTQWNNSCGTSSVTCTGTNFGSTYFGNFADDFGGNLLAGSSGSIGSALGFYSFRRSAVGASDPYTATQYANDDGAVASWLLSADGTLTFSSLPTTVPLPAAAWLLLSGLASLGVISRRKAA